MNDLLDPQVLDAYQRLVAKHLEPVQFSDLEKGQAQAMTTKQVARYLELVSEEPITIPQEGLEYVEAALNELNFHELVGQSAFWAAHGKMLWVPVVKPKPTENITVTFTPEEVKKVIQALWESAALANTQGASIYNALRTKMIRHQEFKTKN